MLPTRFYLQGSLKTWGIHHVLQNRAGSFRLPCNTKRVGNECPPYGERRCGIPSVVRRLFICGRRFQAAWFASAPFPAGRALAAHAVASNRQPENAWWHTSCPTKPRRQFQAALEHGTRGQRVPTLRRTALCVSIPLFGSHLLWSAVSGSLKLRRFASAPFPVGWALAAHAVAA